MTIHSNSGSIHLFFRVAHDTHPAKDVIVVSNAEVAFVVQVGDSELLEAQVGPGLLLCGDPFFRGVNHDYLLGDLTTVLLSLAFALRIRGFLFIRKILLWA